MGTVPSVLISKQLKLKSGWFLLRDLSMSRLHNLALRAPRGNFVKSIVIDPKKSSFRQIKISPYLLALFFYIGDSDQITTFEKESASHT